MLCGSIVELTLDQVMELAGRCLGREGGEQWMHVTRLRGGFDIVAFVADDETSYCCCHIHAASSSLEVVLCHSMVWYRVMCLRPQHEHEHWQHKFKRAVEFPSVLVIYLMYPLIYVRP